MVAATATTDGRTALLWRDPQVTAAGFTGDDGGSYLRLLDYWMSLSPEVGHLMASPLESPAAVEGLAGILRTLGTRSTVAFARDMTISARDWLHQHFADPDVHDLLAPWVMHAGLGPDDAAGGFPLLTLAAIMHGVGMPVARGGSHGLISALVGMVVDHGGTVTTGQDVAEIICETHHGHNRAVGVRTVEGAIIRARRAVVANTTPTQLYRRLLPAGAAPTLAVEQADGYRYGTSDMQIHLALSAPLHWHDERLDTCPTINITGGLDALTLACAQARASQLPATPTFLLGQPLVLDPTRAPAGAGLIWIQLLQQPNHPIADAAGDIPVGGGWTPDVRDRYAQRVLDMLRARTHNLDRVLLAITTLSPADLATRNINWVNGDPYAGACTLDQAYLWRPLPSYGDHHTPVDRLWMCGAATFPGPGVNGASGRIVAHRLLGRRLTPHHLRRPAGAAAMEEVTR